MPSLNELKVRLQKLLALGPVKYLIIGGLTFTIDLGTLVLVHGVLHGNLVLATTLSYWLSVSFNFNANRHWTFKARDRSQLARHATLYGLLLACNYLFTVLFMLFATHILHLNYAIAKVLAVALQICWTYPIYKHVIFVQRET